MEVSNQVYITSCTALIISMILGNTDVYFISHSNLEPFKDIIPF